MDDVSMESCVVTYQGRVANIIEYTLAKYLHLIASRNHEKVIFILGRNVLLTSICPIDISLSKRRANQTTKSTSVFPFL